MGFGKSKHFRPDVLLEDGTELSGYGLDARIVSIPGHSQGSIGVLTSSGNLYCGDLFENRKEPALNSLIDDPETARDSLERLMGMGIKTVYPGHGQSFLLEQMKT
jgi:glyoxylase-like metal-dependent hydrolase (beta-lactamase superfamily II)